ncbi:MAG: glycosyltransferase [Acidimicrobiaceae bacterium]|nr:glycosyltransferase [Acidimicrobiaceae bacterium]
MSTVTIPRPLELEVAPRLRSEHRWARRCFAWVLLRWMDLAVVVPVLAATGVVHAIGMSAWPPLNNDDEGTYMAEAWAVQTGRGPHHGLAQYTYWYDHPPLGWIQLAGLTWLTRAYRAGTVAVVSGRGLMLGYALISCLLVFVVARRLGCSRLWAGMGTAMFGLSPLAVDYLRLVFLDCIGLPWILGAFALALSPRPRAWIHGLSGGCLAVAVLSKETYLIMVPAVLWQAWQASPRRTRRMSMTLFLAVFLAVMSYYPIYAALKGELFAGKGHDSLLGSALWQLGQRAGSGSIFSRNSGSHAQVMSWLQSDPWLIGLAAALIPVAFCIRRLRPVALGYATFGVMLLRHGYLPNAFIVGPLPLAALIIAGVGSRAFEAPARLRTATAERTGVRSVGLRAVLIGSAVALVGLCGVAAVRIAPSWIRSDRAQMTTDAVHLTPIVRAETWVVQHVPRSSTLLVDDDVWTDFVDDGFEPNRVIWAYKLDLDPAVAHRYPDGWRQMDYVVMTPALRGDLGGDPVGTADPIAAVSHSSVIAQFGSGGAKVSILKVHHPSGVRRLAQRPLPSSLQ